MSEIRQRAEQILYGRRLEDKFTSLVGLSDHTPGVSIDTPDLPGRPPSLAFHKGTQRHPFPKPSQLGDERQRAVVLHHFANHELLALELMALALLRFPKASGAFRRTLVQTMVDEQKHLQLYCRRMEELGIQIGDVPVNRFFWDALSNCPDPLTFTCGMSLTFEQANLDFSLFWKTAFMNSGDQQTGELLQTVYEDEIRHVRIGYEWLRKFKPKNHSDWEAYTAHLHFPLSPSRAKGKSFCRVSRVRAGLPEPFIDQVSVYRHSKGRSPALLWFNPECDEEVGIQGHTPKKPLLQMQEDLAHLALFWAQTDDIVLVKNPPSISLLNMLQRLRFPLPEFVIWDGAHSLTLSHPRLREVKPWGWSPSMSKVVHPVRHLFKPKTATRWKKNWKKWYSKAFSQELLHTWSQKNPSLCHHTETVAGRTCQSVSDIPKANAKKPLLLKAPFSTSGRHRIRLNDMFRTEAEMNWIQGILAKQGSLVSEPFLQRLADFSIHVHASGSPQITRFFTDNSGKYRATLINPWDEGLNEDWKRFLHTADGSPQWLQRVSRSLSDHLKQNKDDYPAPFSIDCMLYTGQNELRFKPIVEINPRMTMSRLALSFRSKIAPHCVALWIMGTSRECARVGFQDMDEFQTELVKRNPLSLTSQDKIQSGTLWLTPPTAQTWACVWAAPTLSIARQQWIASADPKGMNTALTAWAL